MSANYCGDRKAKDRNFFGSGNRNARGEIETADDIKSSKENESLAKDESQSGNSYAYRKDSEKSDEGVQAKEKRVRNENIREEGVEPVSFLMHRVRDDGTMYRFFLKECELIGLQVLLFQSRRSQIQSTHKFLKVHELEIPPLCGRKEDIKQLMLLRIDCPKKK